MDILSNEQLAGHMNAVLAIDADAPEDLRLIHTELVRALVRSAAKRLGEPAELGKSAADWQDGHAKGFASGFDHCVERAREVIEELASRETSHLMERGILNALASKWALLMAPHRKDLLGDPPKPLAADQGEAPKAALCKDLFRDGQLHGLELTAKLVEHQLASQPDHKSNHALSVTLNRIRREIYAIQQQGV